MPKATFPTTGVGGLPLIACVKSSPSPGHDTSTWQDHTELMDAHQQEALTGPVPGLRRKVWCRGVGCHHQLTDPESRRRGYGPVCDPDYRNATPAHGVDQDAIPGL